MAINVLRGGGVSADAAPGMPIGEVDREIYSCPNCARPLAVGTRRCPACRARLILGVPAAKAAVFAVFGVAVGLLTGGGLVGAVAMNRTAPPPAQPIESAAPVPSIIPSTAAPTAPITPGQLTPTSLAALRATSAINGRLATLVEPLQTELGRDNFAPGEVALLLRRVSFEAGTAGAFVAPLGRWDAAAGLSTDLGTFYTELRSTAQEGLAASVHNEAAYRQAGARVLQLLGGLASLESAERSLASDAGVELPHLAETGG